MLNPRWSPDGQWLSYATSDGIHLYRLENGESRVIGNRIGSVVSWTANSQSIILRDGIVNGNELVTQLFRYDLMSQQLSAFSPDLAFENLLVAASPTDEWVAVVRRELTRFNDNQIWLVRSNGSESHQLADMKNGTYSNLNWSLDGKYLLYDVYMSNSPSLETRLQVIEIATGKVRDIGPGSNPSWIWNGLPTVSKAQ